MVNELDYYEILEVKRGATDAEIKRSFRRLAQQWHPDVNTDAGADDRFKEINEAYQVLSDPQRRQTTTCSAGPDSAERRGRAGPVTSPGSATSSMRSSAAAAGGRPAAAGRRPGATCATTSA